MCWIPKDKKITTQKWSLQLRHGTLQSMKIRKMAEKIIKNIVRTYGYWFCWTAITIEMRGCSSTVLLLLNYIFRRKTRVLIPQNHIHCRTPRVLIPQNTIHCRAPRVLIPLSGTHGFWLNYIRLTYIRNEYTMVNVIVKKDTALWNHLRKAHYIRSGLFIWQPLSVIW
jgi:hypothetical protein